jgi:dolichol-phosphate mannosyltransferase
MTVHENDVAGGVDVSVLVPVLDEADTLRALLDGVSEQLNEQARTFEVIFVDDGSRDESWRVISELADADPQVLGLRLRRNFGKASALAAAVDEARGEILITMDADLQDDPAEIPNMLAALNDGHDMVSGWKKNRRDPVGKIGPSRLFNAITRWVSGLPLRDFNCGFKAAKAEVYRDLPLYGELHRYIPVLAHGQGYRVGEIPVVHHPRRSGRSKYGFERFARGFLDLLTVTLVTRFGGRPAHLFGGLGLVFGTAGFLMLLYLTGVWALTDQPIGNRPLLLLGVMLMVLSVQLLSFGLLSELIIHRLSRDEPSRRVVEYTRDQPGARG